MSEVSFTIDSEATLCLEEYVEQAAAMERSLAAFALATARVEREQAWALEGAVSMKAFLRHRCRMTAGDAGALLSYGRFLDRYESIAAAAVTSVLSGGHVRAIQTHCPSTVASFLDTRQDAVVAGIAPLRADEADVYMQRWKECVDAVDDQPEPVEKPRSLSHHRLPDGSSMGNFTLDPAGTEAMERAIDSASNWDGAGDTRPIPQRRADALVDVFDHYNKHHDGDGTARHRPHIEIILEIGLDGTTTYSNAAGRPVNAHDAHTWMCDATWQRVTRSGNHILEYGKAARTFPYAVWRAIALRDRGCRFPGCTRPIRVCDAHHIEHYGPDDGPTDYDNGVMLCNRHHHTVHKQRWQLQLHDNAHIEFRRPDGHTETTRPHRRP